MADLDMRALLTDGRGVRHFVLALTLLSGCCFPPVNPAPSMTGPIPIPLPSHSPGGTPSLAPGVPLPPAPSGGLGCRSTRRLEERATAREIPQIADAYELFGDLAGGALDPAVGGVLVCDLRLPGTPWYKSRPDMQARLQIAGGPARILVGHDNRDEVVVTAPLARLSAGDAISVAVEDRDLLTRNDPIDAASGTYNGVFPMLLTGVNRDLHVICQHQSAAATAAELPPLLADVDARVQAYDTAAQRLDRSAEDWGFPWSEREAAERALEATVARVGWSDPRVAPQRQRLVGLEQGWDQRARGDVTVVASAAAPPGSGVLVGAGQLRVSVGASACRTAARNLVVAAGGSADLAPSCVLELHLQAVGPAVSLNLPPDGLPLSLPGSATPELVLPNGWTQGLSVVSGTAASGPIPAGTTTTLLLAADTLCYDVSRQPLKDAVLLRLGGATPRWLKL